jgi:hypothetical protein
VAQDTGKFDLLKV